MNHMGLADMFAQGGHSPTLGSEGELVATAKRVLTTDDIQRMSGHLKPFPLPDIYTPVTWDGFTGISDDVLMVTPPHLIAHMQRTAAQGGFQVVSPRQTPLSVLLTRVAQGRRDLGDHVVGSVAEEDIEWPTLTDFDPMKIIPDEPLPDRPEDDGLRAKTKTMPLTSAAHLLSDPILACLVKGRAVIDILRREDVQGGADEMVRLLANAWGIEPRDLEDMDAYTLGIQGDLLRHAIKTDEVYPTIYAPVHQKRSISVGSNEVTRDYLPLDSAWDWRRMRVLAEAVFAMALNVEGVPYTKVTARPPPGDPAAPLSRPNIIALRPLPCTVWWFGPASFSIMPSGVVRPRKKRAIPKEVLTALSRYVEVVRPVALVMGRGHRAVTKSSFTKEVDTPDGETLSNSYSVITRHVVTSVSRGRTAAATLRNYIYVAIEEAHPVTRMRLSRYVYLAKTECETHLLTHEVPDEVVDAIAKKFLRVGETIRLKVASEAARRGDTAEMWWDDIISQVPARYKELREGSMGWAQVGMWMLLKSPSSRWDGLKKAIHLESLRKATKSAVGAVPLPAERGSANRLLAGARWAAQEITTAYFGYYAGVSDVALAIADAADKMGKDGLATTMREAAYLWSLRGRAFRGTNINPRAHDAPLTSDNHFRVMADPIDLVIAPNPYRAYSGYLIHAMASKVIPREVKAHFRSVLEQGKISSIFSGLSVPIRLGKPSVITRYVNEPWRLGEDMEKSWKNLTADMKEVADSFSEETRDMKDDVTEVPANIEPFLSVIDPEAVTSTSSAMDYYQIVGPEPPEFIEMLEDEMECLPEEQKDEIMERTYASPQELRSYVLGLKRAYLAGLPITGETVR